LPTLVPFGTQDIFQTRAVADHKNLTGHDFPLVVGSQAPLYQPTAGREKKRGYTFKIT
jgi:hypothetical protein